MPDQTLSLREALDALPGSIRLPRGGLRVFAEFHAGMLVGPVKLAVFRVPGVYAQALNGRRGELHPEHRGLLELVARHLQLDHGDTELVVEYLEDGAGSLKLHWVDFSWTPE